MRSTLLALALGALAPAAATAAPGLTVEASAGVAGGLAWDDTAGDPAAGAAALNLGVGWFATPTSAIGVRLASHVLFGRDDVRTTSGFLGLAVQHWWSGDIYGGFGTGIAFLDANGDTQRETSSEAYVDYRDALMVGYGLELRIGGTLFDVGDVAFALEGECLVGRFDNGQTLPSTTTSVGLQLGAQWR